MVDPILGGSTDVAIGKALNGLTARQKVIGNNLANIDTPGFKASSVTFEEQLRRALEKGSSRPVSLATSKPNHITEAGSSLNTVEAEVITRDDTVMRNDGNSVDVDKEMTQLADTAITYSALIQLTTARISLTRYVVNDGRR